MNKTLFLRLDDACPTMSKASWRAVEELFESMDVQPIVGVIPDCKDPELMIDAHDGNFWDQVQSWARKGWTIAMHGLHHEMLASPKKTASLVPVHRRGEFVGQSLEHQRTVIRASYEMFLAHNLSPTMFMAPAHSFDRVTLEALAIETPIRWITDGVSYRAFERFGLNWLPQQLGQLPTYLPPGAWTLCMHPNQMSQQDVREFAIKLGFYKSIIRRAPSQAHQLPKYGPSDQLFAAAYWSARRLRRLSGQ